MFSLKRRRDTVQNQREESCKEKFSELGWPTGPMRNFLIGLTEVGAELFHVPAHTRAELS